MFVRFSLVFLLLGLEGVVGWKRCPPLRSPRHGTVACVWGKKRMDCGLELPVHSVAEFSCGEFYRLSPEGQSFLKCLRTGSWSSAAPKCIADCGRRDVSVRLIVKGMEASRGAFPWHAAIYLSQAGQYEYWCGGSLISEEAVVTAAHCVWEVPPEKLILAFGKFHREYNTSERESQKKRVKRIDILPSYQDASGNYNGDVAVLFLQGRVRMDIFCSPLCVDWEQRLVDKQLSEGTTGMVAGWGLTENDTLGDSLRMVGLPVVSDEECIARQEQDFKKFITFTTFCAGFANGTGVCNGDSGGGLAFFDQASARWYLQGLVSVSPRRKGTPFCDPHYYTVFTKVGAFVRWLKAVVVKRRKESSGVEELVPGRGKVDGLYTTVGKLKRKHFEYPHSRKMLELAGISNTSGAPTSR